MQAEIETTAGSNAGDINEVMEELEINENITKLLETLQILRDEVETTWSRNKKILWIQSAALIIVTANFLLLVFK